MKHIFHFRCFVCVIGCCVYGKPPSTKKLKIIHKVSLQTLLTLLIVVFFAYQDSRNYGCKKVSSIFYFKPFHIGHSTIFQTSGHTFIKFASILCKNDKPSEMNQYFSFFLFVTKIRIEQLHFQKPWSISLQICFITMKDIAKNKIIFLFTSYSFDDLRFIIIFSIYMKFCRNKRPKDVIPRSKNSGKFEFVISELPSCVLGF